jgi:hypothetical protein
MATDLTWRTVPLVSHLHAAEATTHARPPADERLAEALRPSAAAFAGEIRAAGVPAERFWAHLIPQAANTDNRRQLIESCVTKSAGRSPRLNAIVSNLTAALSSLEVAAQAALPKLAEELALRERPLREQWEARGPGLLLQIGALTEPALVPESCQVLLVHPIQGGGGEAHLPYNSVRIEAVLANPVAELPEVVRLAWLIAQVQLDLPIWSEAIHASRLPHVARFALLPPALAAAENVELARLSPDTLRQAIVAWQIAAPPDLDAATLLLEWWQTYQATRPPWRVALTALDRLFG